MKKDDLKNKWWYRLIKVVYIGIWAVFIVWFFGLAISEFDNTFEDGLRVIVPDQSYISCKDSPTQRYRLDEVVGSSIEPTFWEWFCGLPVAERDTDSASFLLQAIPKEGKTVIAGDYILDAHYKFNFDLLWFGTVLLIGFVSFYATHRILKYAFLYVVTGEGYISWQKIKKK